MWRWLAFLEAAKEESKNAEKTDRLTNILIYIFIGFMILDIGLKLLVVANLYLSGQEAISFVILLFGLIFPIAIIYLALKKNVVGFIIALYYVGRGFLNLSFENLDLWGLIGIIHLVIVFVLPLVIAFRIRKVKAAEIISVYLEREKGKSELKTAMKILLIIGVVGSLIQTGFYIHYLIQYNALYYNQVFFVLYILNFLLFLFILKRDSYLGYLFLQLTFFTFIIAIMDRMQTLLGKQLLILDLLVGVIMGIFMLLCGFIIGFIGPAYTYYERKRKKK